MLPTLPRTSPVCNDCSDMGAWGTGIFENDDAMDWAADFGRAPSERLLREAFEAVVGVEDYLERDEGSCALAAAEVLAAASRRPCRDIPRTLRDWATANQGVATPELVAQALAAIDRVMIVGSSELAELWAETANDADAATWVINIDNLRQRLDSSGPRPD
jgi:Domain of unknown function (DUF4259)